MSIVIYFLPTIISLCRGKDTFGLFLFNLLLGSIPPFWLLMVIYSICKSK